MFNGIYGHPEGINKSKTCALIKQFSVGVSGPWQLGGDFNEVLNGDEKWGGSLRRDEHMHDFQEVVDSNHLVDLGFERLKFTWCNNREDNASINKRLD